MDRALNSQEQEKVRSARASFFNTRQPTSTSSSQPESTNSTSTSQPQVNKRSHQEYDTQPITTTPNKRTKMSFFTTTANKRAKISSFKTPKEPMDEAASKSQIIVDFYDPNIGAPDSLGRTQAEILQWSDDQLESSHNYIQMLFPLPEGSPYNSAAPIIDLDVMQAFRSRPELRQQLRLSFERMLKFYGFRVIDKSDYEIKQTPHEFRHQFSHEFHHGFRNWSDAEIHQIIGTASPDSLLDTVSGVARQETVNTGHRTAATRDEAEQQKTETYTDAPIDADSSSTNAEQDVASPDSIPYHIVCSPDWDEQSRHWNVHFNHNHLRITRILRCLRILGLQDEYNAFFTALEHISTDTSNRISNRSKDFWWLAVTRPLYEVPDGSRIKWLEDWEKEQKNLKSVRFDEDMEDSETEDSETE
ncbi:Opioid growth factor receptor region [Pyrenophora tritici-repentis]|nr:Opioid growth factor receptor region [Pyrenophora tritici-repentis]KAI0579767.1 Opioid growth factor receptor (OGFr) region [Pyrenophora tritici-repentis]KAI0583744.1 Opioid growth factor receptor (OGFr) region [Pyrenophora tritici-repentis]KAI0608321.1 Opioid growth factor receptor (OGFr) region [Pyrenophora tritici-repentis]KAI0620568.1 Opioid growth factor receptor (OGFr) region [Pyrenophora tritici-repentis]